MSKSTTKPAATTENKGAPRKAPKPEPFVRIEAAADVVRLGSVTLARGAQASVSRERAEAAVEAGFARIVPTI